MTKMTERLERTQQAMERECRRFIKEEYGIELNVPVEINNRLSRTLGRFITRSGVEYKIDFSGLLLKNGTDEQIVSVLKHECIHYALFKLGRPFRDGQDDFENELKKHGSDSTECIKLVRREKPELSKETIRIVSDLNINIDKIIENAFNKVIQEKIAQ